MLALSGSGAAAAAELDGVRLEQKGGRLDLSAHLEGAFPEEIQGRIRSGLEVSFEYTVRLRRRRSRIMDKTVSERYVVTSVQYSNLTKMYKVTRTIDGAVVASDVTDRPDLMRTWMTSLDHVPLFDERDTETPGTYYARIRAKLLGRFAMLVIPWDLETGWAETEPMPIRRERR